MLAATVRPVGNRLVVTLPEDEAAPPGGTSGASTLPGAARLVEHRDASGARRAPPRSEPGSRAERHERYAG